MDYKSLLGAVAVVIGIISYIPYFRDIFRGATKPHVFSWFVWSLLEGIAFFAQAAGGGGAGTWVAGFTAVACLAIAILAYTRGEKNITRLDRLSFGGALAGIALWRLTADPLFAVLIITVVDMFGFFPTFRKAFFRPEEETAKTFFLSAIKHAIGLAAVGSYNPTTVIYPAMLVVANSAFVIMVLIRRRSSSLSATI